MSRGRTERVSRTRWDGHALVLDVPYLYRQLTGGISIEEVGTLDQVGVTTE